MSDFTQALLEMLRRDPHVRGAFGDPPPLYVEVPDHNRFPAIIVNVKSADDLDFDVRLTVLTSGEQKAGILARLEALATSIRRGDMVVEGHKIALRRIRLMDIFFDDSSKSRNGLLRAKIQITSINK